MVNQAITKALAELGAKYRTEKKLAEKQTGECSMGAVEIAESLDTKGSKK